MRQGAVLERDAELGAIAAAVGDAIDGRGRLVVVEGAAGAGKSTVLAAASEHAVSAGLRVPTARGTELEREFAFGAVRRLLEPILLAASEAECAQLLAGAAAPAKWVIEPPRDDDDPHTRGAAGFAALHAIYWLVANVAARGPLMLVVDDLHWVDAPSLRSLDYLAQRIADLPIVVLGAQRSAEPGAPAALLDSLRGQPGAATLSLGALGPRAVAELVRARIPDADDDVCAACGEQSAGNPLYLEELLRALAPGRASAADVREASLPSLAERVSRRIAHVDARAPALTGAMAVLGDGGRLATAASLAGIAEGDAASIAQSLCRIEVLAAEDPFAFVHPLVRRSAYDRLSITERDAAHTAAASLLRAAGASAEEVATHLGSVRPAQSAATAAALMAAAEQALGRAAPDAAIRWFERALEEDAPEPAPTEILLELGLAEVAARDLAAVEHLRQGLGLAGSVALRARIAVALAEILVHSGQWEAGRDVMAGAVAELDQADAGSALEVLAFWSIVTFYDPSLAGEFDRLRPRFEELAAAGGAWPAYALRATLTVAAGLCGESRDEVVARAELALEDGRLFGERGAGAWASAQVLTGLVAIDEHDLALAACDALDEQARRCGSFIGAASSLGYRGWVLARRGDLAAAEGELHTVSSLVTQAGMPLLITSAMYFLIDAILERPSLDDMAELVQTLELEQAFRASWGGALLFEVRGRLRLMQGDRRGAIDDLREVTEQARALRIGPTFSSCRSGLALALGPEQREEAAELVAEELELARALGLARPEGIALRAAGVLAGGEEGIAQLRASLSVLERSEAALERARTLVELGAALRRAGRRAEARDPLSEGMDLAHRCGAPRLVERARDELRATGARPRRVVRTGVDALTASELRVARLAAAGRTNLEIAQELYVTVKTVETHLSRAYAKLGLAGQGARDKLAGLLP